MGFFLLLMDWSGVFSERQRRGEIQGEGVLRAGHLTLVNDSDDDLLLVVLVHDYLFKIQ